MRKLGENFEQISAFIKQLEQDKRHYNNKKRRTQSRRRKNCSRLEQGDEEEEEKAILREIKTSETRSSKFED